MDDITRVYQPRWMLKVEDLRKKLYKGQEVSLDQECIEEWEEVLEKLNGSLEPTVYYCYRKNFPIQYANGNVDKKDVILAFLSVKEGIDSWIQDLLAEDNYMKVALADGSVTATLFELEERFSKELKKILMKEGYGVLKRLEAPDQMKIQMNHQIALELELRSQGIYIGTAGTFITGKSLCFLYILTENQGIFNGEHNCRKCKRRCEMEQIEPVKIEVVTKNGSHSIISKKRESFLEILQREQIYISATCAGRGTCGTCKIQVLKGNIEMSEEDQRLLSEGEIEKGIRLACKGYPFEDCTIAVLEGNEEEFSVLSSGKEFSTIDSTSSKEVGIAVDIGTTTIAATLMSLKNGEVLGEKASVNHQRTYGADVITRIQWANEGHLDSLRKSIQGDLLNLFEELLEERDTLQKIVISCNTTMFHLLMGYSCEGLGVYPFHSDYLKGGKRTFYEVFEREDWACPVFIFPGFSAFVGGDIVSGLYAACAIEKEEISVLVDLGTNGEMALTKGEKILVTSAAAGPTFEGGNIEWGVPSLPGAISDVYIEGEEVKITTIGGYPPIGICGTGVLAVTAELIKNNYIDDTGALDPRYEEDGFVLGVHKDGRDIVFTQKDIRELQLAKSAIRAGIETLILRANLKKEEVATIYLAGGFGFHIDQEKAVIMGLLPKEFQGKIKTLGNSSLSGAMKYIYDESGQETCEEIVRRGEEIHLANDPDFQDLYLEHMFFEEAEVE